MMGVSSGQRKFNNFINERWLLHYKFTKFIYLDIVY
jgi:hypothetical protein